MWLGLYTVGTILLIAGVGYVCRLAQIPQQWVVGIPVLLLAVGLITAARSLRTRPASVPVGRG